MMGQLSALSWGGAGHAGDWVDAGLAGQVPLLCELVEEREGVVSASLEGVIL